METNNLTENITDYFIQVGILKSPEAYNDGDTFTTDWYNNLQHKQKLFYL